MQDVTRHYYISSMGIYSGVRLSIRCKYELYSAVKEDTQGLFFFFFYAREDKIVKESVPLEKYSTLEIFGLVQTRRCSVFLFFFFVFNLRRFEVSQDSISDKQL